MGHSYGKMPRRQGKKNGGQPPDPSPSELLIAVHGRHTLEQLAREMQMVIARLQDLGVYGVEKFRIRLETRDHQGQPSFTSDRAGERVKVIQINEPASPPYLPGPYDLPQKTAAPAADSSPPSGKPFRRD